MSVRSHGKGYTLVGVLFMTAVFLFEYLTHTLLTVAYIAIAGLAFWFSIKRRHTIFIAFLTSAFLITGYYVSLEWIAQLNQFTILFNRLLALGTVWSALYFTLRYREAQWYELKQRNELQDRIMAEERLKSSEEMYKAIARNFPEGWIGLLDQDLRYVFAEGKGLVCKSLKPATLVGKKFTDTIQGSSQHIEEFLQKTLHGNEVSFEMICNNISYEVNSTPFKNGHTGHRILVVVHDIHALKKTEKELTLALEKERQLGEMKSRFVTLASHEFRTPLTTILSSAFLLESYTGEKFEMNKVTHLGRIKRSVKILTEILNDFLSLGKLEEGEIKPNLSDFDYAKFLSELEKEVEPLKRGQQKLSIHHTGETIINSDKQVLRNILYNLISNAFKYTNNEDEIILESVLTDGVLTVSVTDHGMGIPEDEQQYIFKRFYRAQNAFNIQGTGLGLNIVKRYVKLLEGSIHFTSKPYEKTEFILSVPVKTNEAIHHESEWI